MVLILISGLLLPTVAGAQGGGLEGELTLFPDEPCSLEFRAADVQNVLRSLALPYKVNLLVSERVTGKITASFHEVPVREVFLAILKDAGLGYVQEGRILRVDTIKSIGDSRKEVKAVTEPITRHIQVKYAFDSENSKDLTELAEELRKLLSTDKAANLSIIKRSNTLMVTDLPESVSKIKAMVAKLDKPSKQIAITSKIISATDNFARELGIQWGGVRTRRQGDFTVEGGTNEKAGWKTASRTGKPGSDDTYNTSTASATNYAVNLPAANILSSGVGGSINLLIGKLGSDILEMQLSAMESESKGKVLASPKVITQDNQSAKMESKHKIWYLVTTRGTDGTTTSSYESEDVKITLEVTPHVIGERIFMDVKVEKGTALTRTNTDVPPEIKTNILNTKVLVGSGETVVIGGLIEEDASHVEGGIPWLRDIPLLGWLFSYQTKSDEKKELLIFITPTILEERQQAVDVSASSEAGT